MFEFFLLELTREFYNKNFSNSERTEMDPSSLRFCWKLKGEQSEGDWAGRRGGRKARKYGGIK
jgi:hypothetical protein